MPSVREVLHTFRLMDEFIRPRVGYNKNNDEQEINKI